MTRFRLPLANERGQALVEIGISVSFLILLTIGIVEVGRALMVVNMITHAARDAGRAAAVISNTTGPPPVTNRNTDGTLTQVAKDTIKAMVVADVGTVDAATTISTLDFSQVTTNGVPTVSVTVNGTFPLMFNLLPIASPLTVARTATFRDEGR